MCCSPPAIYQRSIESPRQIITLRRKGRSISGYVTSNPIACAEFKNFRNKVSALFNVCLARYSCTDQNSSPWLLQIENSNSCSDSDAVESLAGDATEDDSEAGGFMWCGKGVDTHTIHWERRVALEDIMELAQHALSHLPPETMTKVLGDVRTLFDSRPSQLASSGNCSTSSSFDFSQPEGNYESTVPIRRGQKRSLDEGDEQLPNNEDNNPRKRQNLHGTLDAESRPMWACPFYKREPHRYCDKTELGDFRKCARSPGFPEVHRVKSVYPISFWSMLTCS